MPRDRKGRYTAERTTTTVTERLTVDDAPLTHPPPPATGRPLRAYGFASLLTSPPPGARWAHPEFIATEAARAAATPLTGHTNPFPDRPRRSHRPPVPAALPVIMVPRGVPYPALEEDTLAGEFEPLPLELGAPPPEMTP